jgi:hypothetical protein
MKDEGVTSFPFARVIHAHDTSAERRLLPTQGDSLQERRTVIFVIGSVIRKLTASLYWTKSAVITLETRHFFALVGFWHLRSL